MLHFAMYSDRRTLSHQTSPHSTLVIALGVVLAAEFVGSSVDIRRGAVLLRSEECKDVTQTCPQGMKDDFDFIECLSTYGGQLSENCQNVVWKFTAELLKDESLRRSIRNHCSPKSSDWLLGNCRTDAPPRPGGLLMCLLFRTATGENDVSTGQLAADCRDFVRRLKLLTFMDLGTMSQLLNECDQSINNLHCGRVKMFNSRPQQSSEKEVQNQDSVLTCMQGKISELSGKCKEVVLQLSELQAEDMKLNRDLFVHCTGDRLRFCQGIPINDGQNIHKCLFEHKSELAVKCREMFYHHEQLIVQDYQVSRGLVRMCKEDIRRNHCRKSVSSDKDIRLAQILICLENVTKNGTKVNNECLLEMLTHRKILMEDYRLSPELVSACSDNISQLCSGVETGGRTIHCLMEHTRTRRRKDRIAPQCQRQLEALLKEVDVASDWTVDPVLREACSDFVSNYCKGGYQSSRVLSCLTEHLGSLQMSSECETAVLQIQYFVQRDYKLNSDLYRECRSDAITLCHAKRSWADDPSSMDPVRAPIVLPCLYRHALPPSNSAMPKLQRGCLVEVLRMMRQRALIVQLNPEVEQACIEDLAQHCSVKTGKGEEMLCLQDRLDSLSKSCRAAVSNYTELQSAHLIMNPIILSNCEDVISKLCENDVNAVTGGDALECLIEHKNDAVMRANPKCRAAVEHQQLISLKDFHFTFRFKDACQQQVSRFCNNARTKFEVVSCLSEIVRNDALADHKPHIPRECRQQLRAQLLQQRENIDLDPTLKEACKLDISRLCKNVARGNARVLECLESRRKNLTIDCYKRVFNIERQDLMDSSTDYTLLSTCKSMMIKYCSDKDPEKVFDCLKKFKYEAGFDAQCRLVIIKRMIEQNTDYRLNPALQKDCQQDIVKFCSEAIAALKKDDPKLEGKVIRCLKTKFRERKLSSSCENQLGVILKEAALNYELNPLLTMLCNTEINQFCKSEVEEDANKGKGRVEECLKAALLKGNIKNRVCRIELVELIEEGKADIQTDPLLFRACSQDISSHCSDVSKGNSRQLNCIMNILNSDKKLLSNDCRNKLSQRVEMYTMLRTSSQLNDFGELYVQVSNSPAKRYFVVVAFTFVGMIFITGMFCGRVIRRSATLKNK